MTLLEGYICSGYAQLILVFVLTGGLAYGEQEYAHLMDETYHRMAFAFCCLLQLCVNLRFLYRAKSAIHVGAEKIGSFGKIDKFQVSTLRKHGVLLNKWSIKSIACHGTVILCHTEVPTLNGWAPELRIGNLQTFKAIILSRTHLMKAYAKTTYLVSNFLGEWSQKKPTTKMLLAIVHTTMVTLNLRK